MSDKNSKMAENEVIFRQFNENIQKGLADLEKTAREDGQMELLKNHDDQLHFYCECADEKCLERIIMKPSKYQELHKTLRQFIIIPGHDVPQIERIIKKARSYQVVEKNVKPPPTDGELNPTHLHNT